LGRIATVRELQDVPRVILDFDIHWQHFSVAMLVKVA
jgi:hypothetical protein